MHRGPALAFDGVTKRYGPSETAAVSDVTFVLGRGQILGVLGPNGSGKSTLLRIAAGLVLPSSGRVLVSSRHRDPRERHLYPALAVADERSFNLRLTVEQNLRFFAALHGLDYEAESFRAREVLESMKLSASTDVPYGHLSSGNRHRLALCRSLLIRPEILLLDEPTRGLDPTGAEEFLSFVRDELVEERGIAVVLVSHTLPEVLRVSDLVMVLVQGRARYFGSPARLPGLKTESIRLVAGMPRSSSELSTRLEDIPGVSVVDASGSELVLEQRRARDASALERLFAELSGCGAVLSSILPVQGLSWSETWNSPPQSPQLDVIKRARRLLQPPSLPGWAARRAWRSVLAQLRAEFLETVSYRLSLGLDIATFVLFFAVVALLANLVPLDEWTLPTESGSYGSFAAIGLLVSSSALGLSRSLPGRMRQLQLNGTLEAIIASGTPVSAVAAAGAAAELLQKGLRCFAGAVILLALGFPLPTSNWIGALFVLLIGLPAFAGIGMISTAFVVVYKKGDPIAAMYSLVSFLASGALVPVRMLPQEWRVVADAFPLTHLLDAVRSCMSEGIAARDMPYLVVALGLFSLGGMAGGLAALRLASDRAARDGSHSQY